MAPFTAIYHRWQEERKREAETGNPESRVILTVRPEKKTLEVRYYENLQPRLMQTRDCRTGRLSQTRL